MKPRDLKTLCTNNETRLSDFIFDEKTKEKNEINLFYYIDANKFTKQLYKRYKSYTEDPDSFYISCGKHLAICRKTETIVWCDDCHCDGGDEAGDASRQRDGKSGI